MSKQAGARPVHRAQHQAVPVVLRQVLLLAREQGLRLDRVKAEHIESFLDSLRGRRSEPARVRTALLNDVEQRSRLFSIHKAVLSCAKPNS